jgi:thioredoxin 1
MLVLLLNIRRDFTFIRTYYPRKKKPWLCSADWCPFCQKFKPIFESAANSPNSRLKFYGFNINDDDNPLWERFSINAVPTLIAFEKGKIASRRDANMGLGLNKSDLDSILFFLISNIVP